VLGAQCAFADTPKKTRSRLVTNESAAKGLKLMSQLNAIIFNDMTASHDVEGKTWVGGGISGSSFTAGMGSVTNPAQGAKAGYQKTLTVGGANSVGVLNLNNGSNGGAGKVGANGTYGIVVGGISSAFNINDTTVGATIKSGGKIGGKIEAGAGSTVKVWNGNVEGLVKVGDNSTVKINGGITGSELSIGAGSTAVVQNGVQGELKLGSGSKTRIGGNVTGNTSLAAGTAAKRTTLAVGGFTGLINGAAYSDVSVGGDVNGQASVSNNSTLTVRGKLTSDLSANGNSGTVVRLGGYGGNVNALNNGQTAYVSQKRDNPPSGWFFSNGYAKPAAPATITNATLETTTPAQTISSTTAAMLISLRDLSATLKALPTIASNTITKTQIGPGSSTYDWIFNVNSTSSGYAVFTVAASDLLDKAGGAEGTVRNIGFSFGSGASNLPIVINVTGLGNSTWTWNLNGTSGYTSAINQQVIWNFNNTATSTGKLSFTTIVHGSVLATESTVSNSTPIEGSLVARVFNQGGEVHLGTYNGNERLAQTMQNFSAPVPEPVSWAMMVVGFGLTGGMIRRQRRWAAQAA
jgi:choice-of-anchor A domain-containing protein